MSNAKPLTPLDQRKQVVDRIINEVAERHGVQPHAVRAWPGMRGALRKAKSEVCFRLRKLDRPEVPRRLTLQEIAECVGLTDHSSAHHHIRRHAREVGE